MTTNINWDFISSLEGKGIKKGYVPSDNSGVTIATGFDLKEKTPDFLINELGVSEETTGLLSNFMGMSGAEAREVAPKLNLNEVQVKEIDTASKKWYANQVVNTYNKHNPVKPFEELTQAQQTVLASVGFQHGTSFTRSDGTDMNYIKQAASGDWDGALANLRNFGDEFGTRRNKEADYLELEKKIKSGNKLKKFIPTDTTKQKNLFSELPDVSRGLFLDTAYNNSEYQKFIEEDINFFEGTKAAIRENNIFANSFDIFFAPTFIPENGFAYDNNKEEFEKIIKDYGLNVEFREGVLRAVNPLHLEFLAGKAQRHQKNAEVLSGLGWTGTALSIGALILDPVNLTGYGALNKVMKSTQFLTGLSRREHFVKSALAYGSAEGALYSPVAYNSPTMGLNDIIIASALGGTLGGGISALMAKNLKNVAVAMQKTDLVENGLTPTAKANATVFKNVKHTKDNKKLQKELIDTDLVEDKEIMFPVLRNLPFLGFTTSRSGTLGSSKSEKVKAFGFKTLEEYIGWGKKGDKAKIGREFVSQGETTDITRDLIFNAAHAKVYTAANEGKGLEGAMKGYLTKRGYGGTIIKNIKGFMNFDLKAQYMYEVGVAARALAKGDKAKLSAREAKFVNDPDIRKGVEAYADGYSFWAKSLGQKDGVGVEGAEDLSAFTGRYYMPQKLSSEGYEKIITKGFSDEDIETLVTGSIMSRQKLLNKYDNPLTKEIDKTTTVKGKNPKTGEAEEVQIPLTKARQLAKYYVKALRYNKKFGGFDIEQLVKIKDPLKLKAYIDDVFQDLSDIQKDDLFNGLKPQLNLKTSGRFEQRIRLDPNFEMAIPGKGALRFDELLENDADLLWHSYTQEMSGWYSLAKVNGIKSRDQWLTLKNELINDINKTYNIDTTISGWRKFVNKGNIRDALARDEEVATIESIFNNLMGRSTELGDPSTGANAWLRDLRRYNFIRVLNQVGIAQIPEFGIGVSNTGLRALLNEIKPFRKLIEDGQQGKLPNTVLKDMSVIGAGNGDEQLYKIVQSNEMLDRGAQGVGSEQTGFLSKGAANALEKGTGYTSGLIHVDRANRKLNMKTFVNDLAENLIDVSKGGKVLENIKKGKLNRYRVLGLEDKELVALAKEFTEGKNVISYKNYLGRRVLQFDFLNFKDQDLVRKFAIAVNRYTKRTVQYNLIGDTSRFFSDRALGKTMGQFRQFIMTAWGKQFLHNVAMGDLTTFAMFMNTTMLGGLAYVAQANFNAVGMSDSEKKKYLKKKLGEKGDYSKIAIASFQRAGWSSMMPPYIDMMMGVASPENRFNTRSSGMETDLVNGNPTTDLMKKLLKVAGNGIRAGVRSDYDFSKQDLNRIMRLFPYQNLYGINNMLNFLKDNSGLPDKSKRQLY